MYHIQTHQFMCAKSGCEFIKQKLTKCRNRLASAKWCLLLALFMIVGAAKSKKQQQQCCVIKNA